MINNEDDDCEYLKESLYRSQLLQAFNINEMNQENNFENVFKYINKYLIKSEKGKMILEIMKINNNFTIKDMEIVLLFSYDYFYLFHNCLIDLFTNGDIKDENFNLLIKQIENNK